MPVLGSDTTVLYTSTDPRECYTCSLLDIDAKFIAEIKGA